MPQVLPLTAQEIFAAVVAAGCIPWIPDDADAQYLTWHQLVRENRVPAEFGGLINDLQRIADKPLQLRAYAKRHNLEFPDVRRD
jgi:hypothetical protein